MGLSPLLCSGASFSECLKNLLGEAVIRRIFILRLVLFCVIVRLLRIGLPHAQERTGRSNPHLYKRALSTKGIGYESVFDSLDSGQRIVYYMAGAGSWSHARLILCLLQLGASYE
jgi:hypothetical protein